MHDYQCHILEMLNISIRSPVNLLVSTVVKPNLANLALFENAVTDFMALFAPFL